MGLNGIYDYIWKTIKRIFFLLADLVMGIKYFRHCSRTMGDILAIVDSIFLIPILGFCFLLYLIIKHVWFE